jgi:hypothetical protein
MVARTFVALLVALSTGCGSSDESPVTPHKDLLSEVGSGDVNELVAAVDMSVLDAYTVADISGSWAQLQVVATVADAPIIGQVDTLSIALVRWEIEQSAGGLLTIEQVACELELTSDSAFVQMLIPDAFVDSIVAYQKPGSIDLSVQPPQLSVPLHPEVHGANLSDPLNDPMPTSAEDPRIVDGDNDGQPGLTVYVSGVVDGALYVVQRNLTTIDGVVSAPNRMEGQLGFAQEQVVLGSDNTLLADNPPISAVDPDPTKSYFESVRVPADWGCEEIIAKRAELFEEESP